MEVGGNYLTVEVNNLQPVWKISIMNFRSRHSLYAPYKIINES